MKRIEIEVGKTYKVHYQPVKLPDIRATEGTFYLKVTGIVADNDVSTTVEAFIYNYTGFEYRNKSVWANLERIIKWDWDNVDIEEIDESEAILEWI